MYNETVKVNKTHLSDSRFQQQKAEAGQRQLQQQQLLLVVGSTAYYRKLQQEPWILHTSMSPKEKEWKKTLLWGRGGKCSSSLLYKSIIKEIKKPNIYLDLDMSQIQLQRGYILDFIK